MKSDLLKRAEQHHDFVKHDTRRCKLHTVRLLGEMIAEVRRLTHQLAQDKSDREIWLEQMLVDCDEVAMKRGDQGLCDSISNSGEPYGSEALARALRDARSTLAGAEA